MGFLNGGNQYSHEDARQVICSCCGIKTSKKKKMNENEEALVRKVRKVGRPDPRVRWDAFES